MLPICTQIIALTSPGPSHSSTPVCWLEDKYSKKLGIDD
jgi:hypothetical protein